MAHSVEVRLPFLSPALVELAFSIPGELKICEGWTKYIERKAMEPYLPTAIVWNKTKTGFEAPQEKWFSENRVKDMVKESKKELERTGIFVDTASITDWRCIMLAGFANTF
jgi:asparagine synthase (glutamine-hydrolysing)